MSLERDLSSRSLLIAGLISEDFEMTSIGEAPEELIDEFFATDFDDYPAAVYMLPHLKGLTYFYPQDFEGGTSGVIFDVFRKIPAGKWITFENLIQFVNSHFLTVMPLSDWKLGHKVQAEFENNEGKWSASIHAGNKWELVGVPYLAGHVFLMAAFGLMDIALDPAVQNRFAPYENLYGFRLTELGAYVLGLRENYYPPVSQISTTLTFDEASLTIRIDGDVALGDTLLANFASRLTENRYQFSAGKFLKDCKKTVEIKNKIELFKQTVGQKLPRFWEDYFLELVENSKSIRPKPSVKVFAIPPKDKALQRHIAQDDVLRKLVIKAEQYHIIISESDLTQFSNRMKELGYVMG